MSEQLTVGHDYCTRNRIVPKNNEVVGPQSSYELWPWNNYMLGYSNNQLCH